jgi:signal transduction histidine kinase
VTERPAAPHQWQSRSVFARVLGRPAGEGPSRSTAEFLLRSAQSYASFGRGVIGVLVAVIAPFADPPIGVPACIAVSVCFAAWSGCYAWRMRRRPEPWLWWTDVAVLVALSLAQPLLVDPGLTGRQSGWVTPIVSFALAAMQWHTSTRSGLVAIAVLGAALSVGALLSPGVGVLTAVLAIGLWTVVEGLLSRLLWRLVERGGRIADDVMDKGFAQERAAATAAARRADQRLHWSTVHDTAASTLLMVGLGEVHGDEPWLAGQISRDIAALADEPVQRGELSSLSEMLNGVVVRAIIDVHLELPEGTEVSVPTPVGVAIEGAVGEALENVRRHARTDRALVRLVESPGRVLVTVSDSGAGFEPAAVPSSRHGLVLSIRERMARAGGRAEIRSEPGVGTVVELEWSDG